jgi:hypothetical protein
LSISNKHLSYHPKEEKKVQPSMLRLEKEREGGREGRKKKKGKEKVNIIFIG